MPPVKYTTDNYPDRTENANPDENIGQHMTEGDQAIPGGTGSNSSTPAGEDGNILASGFGIGVTLVVGYLQRDGVAPNTLITVDRIRTCARLPIAEVPLVAIGRETTVKYIKIENKEQAEALDRLEFGIL